ncbi:FUSC family protein [Gorillibacterium timonense]|uniref:FUSC family protein n=1 Tax=Gorillibacterium timonense TaxID=1689269 RepID=UPI00071DB7F9|nr:aromatic acid exporter family protein [Gorillibacterium timonense]
MTFGARVLKTGVAVTLALYASTQFGLTPPVIAAIAAVFAMQPSIYRSWRYFWEQLQTNTLGALLAVIALHFFGNDPIAVGLVCILVIMLCLKMKMEETLGLTLVTVIVVMEAPAGQLDFALNRFLLSCIGIACAFVVNLLLLPPNPRKQYFEQIESVFDRLSLLLRTLISDEIKETVYREEKKKLRGLIKGLSDKYDLFEEEHKKLRKPSYSGTRRLVVYKQMLTVLNRGAEILEVAEEHYFQSERPKGTDARFDHHLEQMIKRHEHILLKFQNKLKRDSDEDAASEEANRIFLLDMLKLSTTASAHEDRERDAGEIADPTSGKEARREPEETASGEHAKELHGASEESANRLRLAVVAAAVYDYGFQINRLDKLVVHDLRNGEEASDRPALKVWRWWK